MKTARLLGACALVLGGFAVVAGSPRRDRSALDVNALAREVTEEADHVTAVELASWIRDRRPSLRVVDIRDSVEFEQYHIPRAERFALSNLVKTQFASDETIVLYSGGGAHAAQAWVLLRARGLNRVFFLRGGIDEWLDEVMNPQIPSNARPAEREYMDSVAVLSRYFGGVPREVDSLLPSLHKEHTRPDSASWRASVARIRGKGC